MVLRARYFNIQYDLVCNELEAKEVKLLKLFNWENA